MTKQPYFVAGAGDLVSHVHQHELNSDDREYRFNLFRVSSSGEATNWFRPGDLRDLVKSCQVLAFSIANDGWIDAERQRQLTELAADLQQITDRWEQQDA